MEGGSDKLLRVEGIHSFYGNIEALKGISFYIREGEIITLIGSNGAGKTTTLNTISGLVRPKEGEIIFMEERISQYRPHEIVKKGISLVPEGRKIFSRLTVLENLEMGAFTRKSKADIKRDMEEVFNLFPRLKERKSQIAGTLSGGEQQMLAIGRAMMTRPKLLLLDEPSMGLAPVLVETIFDTIGDINERGTTVMLVEQNAWMAFKIANRGYVIQSGSIIMEDKIENLRENETIKKAYLGG